MATFNSVLIGKAKGKVGNVVLTSIKGQNIVKSLNDKPANPRSVGQTDNRIQMSNAVLAWQFLSMFFASAGAIAKSTESTYNAFVRLVKSGMSNVLISSRVLAAKASLELGVFVGNWFSVVAINSGAVTNSVQFVTNGIQWVNTMNVVYVEFDIDGANYKIITLPILEVDFNSSEIVITGSNHQAKYSAAYIYDSASSKITNICFSEI